MSMTTTFAIRALKHSAVKTRPVGVGEMGEGGGGARGREGREGAR